MTVKIGLKCKTYQSGTTLGGGVPTWVLVARARDVSLNLEHTEAEIQDRSSDWTKVLLGLKEAGVEFDFTYDPEDASHQALLDAWINKTDLAMAFMDDAITTVGAEGLQMDVKVVAFSVEQPLQEGSTVSVTVKPSAESSAEPEWVEVVV